MPNTKFGKDIAKYMETAIATAFPEEKTFQIFVKISGKTITLDVAPSDTGIDVKKKIEKKTAVPIDADYWISYSTTTLQDDDTIESKKITKEANLGVNFRGRGGVGERKVINAMVVANIKHGNVTEPIIDTSGESTALVTAMRDMFLYPQAPVDYSFLPNSLHNDVTFMNDKMPLIRAALIENFGAANCDDFGEVVFAKLLTETTGQFVYKAYIPGHVFALTSPEYIADNDASFFTKPDDVVVVDAWDTNSIKALPFFLNKNNCYGKKYNANEIKITSRGQAGQVPLPQNVLQSIQQKVSSIKVNLNNPLTPEGLKFLQNKQSAKKTAQDIKDGTKPAGTDHIYHFDPKLELTETRTTAEFEKLLLATKSVNRHVEEVSTFDASVFTEVLKSAKNDVLQILYNALAAVSKKVFNTFCSVANTAAITSFFSANFSLYAFDSSLSDFLNGVFADSKTNQIKILESLMSGQIGYYAFSAVGVFKGLLPIQQVFSKLKSDLTVADSNSWTTFWGLCSKQDIKDIVDKLISLDKEFASLVLNSLPENAFEAYICEHNAIDTALGSGNTNTIIKKVYTILKKFGVKKDTSAKSRKYETALGSYRWAGYNA